MIAALTRDAPADSLPIIVGMPCSGLSPSFSRECLQPQSVPPSTLIKNGKVVRK
jgi:hypothetical protein